MLENLLRIGRRAIVSFPNFGFWRMRLQLLVGGHMPRTENLPATLVRHANIHFCTIKDFVELCDAISVKMERAVALDLYGRPLRLRLPWWVWNMFGEQGVFLLSRGGKESSLARHCERADARSDPVGLPRRNGSLRSLAMTVTRRQRPRIAHRPAAGFDQRDEALDASR